MMTDPVADLLTRIRNASRAEHEKVDIPVSKLKLRVVEVLKSEGFIKSFRVIEEAKPGTLRVYLKYGPANEKIISGIVRVSKPGRRIYTSYKDVPWVLSGMGIAILTTPKGVMTGEQARRERVGGEVLCYIW